MKVVLVGAHGQLGRALSRSAPESTELYEYGRVDLDITDARAVADVIHRDRPDFVINAAAYTAVDRAESHPQLAHAVNAAGPRNLALSLADSGGRLLHVSTDFVFDGSRPAPYSESDQARPLNVYGLSKLEGERAVFQVLEDRATVVRTSWLYAREGTNFVNTMLHAMSERISLSVVYDQTGTPTWTRSLARAIWRILEIDQVGGTHHWTDAGVASWYDFAVAIQEEALARGVLTRTIPIVPIRTRDYPTPARRPAYSVLDKERTTTLLATEPAHWRVNLRAMFDECPAP